MCCYSGKISLLPLERPPRKLYNLWISHGHEGKSFCEHIRNYNHALAMTSVGRKVDDTLNRAGGGHRGPYSFRIHGELSHLAGSLLPPEDRTSPPVYAQLYITDSVSAHPHRMANAWNSHL